MTFKDYRANELTVAIIRFHDAMEAAHQELIDLTLRQMEARHEIVRRELEAWRELQQVLLADAPGRLSEHFKTK